MTRQFYVTCAIPYVNAAPHIGHALEFVQGDTIARYHRLLGHRTLLLSGGDENALKNVQAAEKAGIPVQKFIDDNTQKFLDLTRALGCAFDIWQKGSDTARHFPASQKLWKLCDAAGDIYKKSYEGLYCVGCEAFYEPDDLNEHGECVEHPGKRLDVVREENYFFRLSKYRDQIISLIESDSLHISPVIRKNEILSFLKNDLKDISVSRSNERARNWGVPVPGDDSQRMYVWFDALNIYQSGIGFGWNDTQYKKFWPADVHVIGKGISRFHAVYWPAFLLSAGLTPPKSLFVHGYFTVNGQKMSKTLGNVIDPFALIDTYGADPLRYYFLREIPAAADGDFSQRRFRELYNADLANGLGNLVSRVAQMIHRYCKGSIPAVSNDPQSHPLVSSPDIYNEKRAWTDMTSHVENYAFHEALASVWNFIRAADKYVDDTKPWSLVTTDKKQTEWVLYGLADAIHQIAWLIAPFLPETSRRIAHLFCIDALLVPQPVYSDSWANIPAGTIVGNATPLFPRLTK